MLCRANNQLEQLIEEYQKQIENSPENICLQRLLGDAYYHLGDNQQAAKAYRRMFELIGQKNAIEASTTSSEFDSRLKELGLHKELADYYQRKFDSGDFDDYELQLLFGLYAHLNEIDRMVEIYKAMVQKRGVDTEEQLSHRINAEKLMALLEKYVERHPQDGMTYKLLADLHLHQGDIDGAIKLYERSASIDPDNIEARTALGKLYAERMNYDKAAQHYEKTSSLRPEEPYYKAHLAYAYNRLGKHDEAIAIGQKLTQEDENDPVATLVLGCVYFNAVKYENAIEEFNRVLQYEESYQALLDDLNKFLAIAYLKAGKPEAMNLTPWTLGDVLNDCAEEGDYDGMLQMATAGIRNKQDAWKPMWAQGDLINSFIEAGQFDKLIDAFERELKNDPDNALVYKMLGYIYESMARRYRQTEKYSEAEAMFQKALTLTDDNNLKAEIYYHLGDVYQMQKQYDKAIPAYQEIIKLKPKDIDARQQLAHIYERTEQYEKAISIYQDLIEFDKRSIDGYKKAIERCLENSSK